MVSNGIAFAFSASSIASCDYYSFPMRRARSVEIRLPAPSARGWRGTRRKHKNGNKITSLSLAHSLSLVMAFSSRPQPMRFLFASALLCSAVSSISLSHSIPRFSKLVFNIQNGILIKSNLSIPSEYISRNDKI